MDKAQIETIEEFLLLKAVQKCPLLVREYPSQCIEVLFIRKTIQCFAVLEPGVDLLDQCSVLGEKWVVLRVRVFSQRLISLLLPRLVKVCGPSVAQQLTEQGVSEHHQLVAHVEGLAGLLLLMGCDVLI